jgi:photosystem II PsbM protein
MFAQPAVQSYGAQAFMSAAPPPAFGMVDFQAPMPVQVTNLDHIGQQFAGVVAVDGGTTGLEVQFGAFLAVILGLFIPVVFLITVYIQSDAQGTATTFRQPDSIGGTKFEDE